MATFEQIFKKRNPNHAFLLRRMQKALGKSEITFDDINTTNLRTVREYMEGEVTPNSLKVYMAIIFATVNNMADDGLVRHINTKAIGRIKTDKVENVALTEEEVNLFVDYYKRNYSNDRRPAERDCLTLFLIEIFTGARSSDVARFSIDNISDGVLSYVSKKTHTLTRVPAHSMLPLLFSRIPKKEYSFTTKSRSIQRVAKELGITQMEKRMFHGELKARPRYEYIATHTARRTFVSLLLDKGVPLASVSKLAGHNGTNMTMRYYCSDKINLNEEAMAFFK